MLRKQEGGHTHAGLKSPIGYRVRLEISQKSRFSVDLITFYRNGKNSRR
jgi:hypothetical protein